MPSAPKRPKPNPANCAERKPFRVADFFSGLLETAFAEEAKAKPKRKMPTDLSDVSAAFAALDSDED